MISKLFIDLIFISLSSSLLVLLLLIFNSVIKTRISPVAKYIIWLLLLIKLAVPYSIYQELPLTSAVFNSRQNTQEAYTSEFPISLPEQSSAYESTGENTTIEPVVSDTGTTEVKNNLYYFIYRNLNLLSLIWVVGFALILLYKVIIEVLLRRKIGKAAKVVDETFLELFEGLQQRSGVIKNIEIRESAEFGSPAVYGTFKPILIIPDIKKFLILEPSHMRTILLHELNHIRNNDNIVRMIASFINSVYWFNPLIWLLDAFVRNSQEMICDSRVLSFTPVSGHRKYADLILEFYSEENYASPVKLPAFISNKSLMRDRLLHVLFYAKIPRVATAAAILSAVVLFGVSFIIPSKVLAETYAAMRIQIEENEYAEVNEPVYIPSPPTTSESPLPTEKPSQTNSIIDDNGYIVFSDSELESLLASELNVTPGKITSEMLEGISYLEIWGKNISINQPYTYSISFYDSNGEAFDIDGIQIPINGGIESLKDIEMMTNIRVLSVNQNNITDLPDFSNLLNLQTIRLMSNRLEDISMLETLQSPYDIYLCNNRIKDISPLATLETLSVAWLGSNNISAIPDLSPMISLREIRLEKNGVRSIDGLSEMPGLEKLSLAMNSITDISPLSENTGLTNLALLSNNISDLSPLKDMTNMEELFINSNNISDITPLEGMEYLEFLNCSGNHLDDISVLLELKFLKSLYFVDNKGFADMSLLDQMVWLSDLVTEH